MKQKSHVYARPHHVPRSNARVVNDKREIFGNPKFLSVILKEYKYKMSRELKPRLFPAKSEVIQAHIWHYEIKNVRFNHVRRQMRFSKCSETNFDCFPAEKKIIQVSAMHMYTYTYTFMRSYICV